MGIVQTLEQHTEYRIECDNAPQTHQVGPCDSYTKATQLARDSGWWCFGLVWLCSVCYKRGTTS